MAEETKEKQETKRKSIKISLPSREILALALVGLIIVVGGILFFVFRSGNSPVQCTSQECFNKQFVSCQPATWTANDTSEEITIKYTINYKASSGCNVTFSTDQTSSIKITCNYDNSKSFIDAETAASVHPKAYDCHKA
jgi:flagellar basal body-associated protein FliL